jgi:hypothetical protein
MRRSEIKKNVSLAQKIFHARGARRQKNLGKRRRSPTLDAYAGVIA